MRTTLKSKTLTGVNTAGSSSVEAEGHSTTTNRQQVLCKAWGNFNQISTQSLRDSFNLSSITDGGNGTSSFAVSSSFSNTNVEVTGGSVYVDNNWRFSPRTRLTATSTIEFQAANSSQTLADADQNSFNSHGDLA